jgi:hypothetical protein
MGPRKSQASAAAAVLGRLGGRVKSPAKTAAARRNAQLAGRRPKFAAGDAVRVIDRPATSTVRTTHWGESGVIQAQVGRARYAVALDSGALVRLPSHCLIAKKARKFGRK